MPEGQRPRGVTPRLKSGAVAESTRLQWCRNSWEELPCVRGQGVVAERRYPAPEVRNSHREELPHAPKPKARGGGQKEQPTPEARGGNEMNYPVSEVGATARRRYPTPQA